MTEKDEDDAVRALINWFVSQDISPTDAQCVMAKAIVSAIIMTLKGLPESAITYPELSTRVIAAMTLIPAALELKFQKGVEKKL